ncbi:MAG: DedA protein [Jatrophihabitantaceae bacterium]|nr:DedA protein [Jatrophihabitantaceae bacterium]
MSHAALLGDLAAASGGQVLAAPQFMDPNYLLDTFGLAGLLIIVFAECGLLIGFFLPGDSLLFTAGLLVAAGTFDVPLWALLVGVPIAAVLGNIVGYWIGRKAGTPLFERPDSKLFKRKYIEQTSAFFQARGPFAIVAARFVPVVRTFVTVVAGVSGMNYRTFIAYSAIGGVLWGAGVTLLGYFLGQIDFVANHVEVIIVGIVALSLIPIVLEYLKARKRSQAPGAG